MWWEVIVEVKGAVVNRYLLGHLLMSLNKLSRLPYKISSLYSRMDSLPRISSLSKQITLLIHPNHLQTVLFF